MSNGARTARPRVSSSQLAAGRPRSSKRAAQTRPHEFQNRQRFRVVKMAAGNLFVVPLEWKLLFFLPARAKVNSNSLNALSAQTEFASMLDNLRRQFARLANFAIGDIVFELKREKFEREFGEFLIADC